MDERHHVAVAEPEPPRPPGRPAARVNSQPRLVGEARAAELLGVSTEKLRQLSNETGLGRPDYETGQEQFVFTYAELYRLCRSVVMVSD